MFGLACVISYGRGGDDADSSGIGDGENIQGTVSNGDRFGGEGLRCFISSTGDSGGESRVCDGDCDCDWL